MGFLKTVSIVALMGILIFDSRCAIAGASEGIAYCIQTVIPSLFPFFVLSTLLVSKIDRLPKAIQKLYRIGPNSGGILLSGLIGGYPTGARAVSQAYTEGKLSLAEAKHLLPICNQCGPAFLFGMTAMLFDAPYVSVIIWLIHLLSGIILANILRIPPSQKQNSQTLHTISLNKAMSMAITSMAGVCGWVILFRMIYRFLLRWFLWALPLSVRVLISGILEMANGCKDLQLIGDSATRFVLTVLITGFGGFCVSMQTFGVLHSDLMPNHYFPGKVLQTGIGTLMASVLVQTLYPVGIILILMGIIGLFCEKKSKITVAFPDKSVYNGAITEARECVCFSEKR